MGFSTTTLTEKATEPIWLILFYCYDSLLQVFVPLLLITNKYKVLEKLKNKAKLVFLLFQFCDDTI